MLYARDKSAIMKQRMCTLSTLFLVILFFSVEKPMSAQVTATREDTSIIPWAFAVAIGSGIYGIGEENTIYVIRAQPRISIYFSEERTPGERRFKLEFKLPVAIGVHHFDIIRGEFPSSLQNISFAPGVEVQIPVTSRWTLRPHVHFGYGRELASDGESAWIYWAGLRSLLTFGVGKFDFGLINTLTRGGYTPNMGEAQNLSMLGTGLEIDHPLGSLKSGGDQLYIKSHVFNFWYLDQLELFLAPDRDPVELRMEWEIGLAIGKKGKLKIWLFKFDRIGIGYRFSDYTQGIRIFFGSYFN
jgi:hypothetical protein